MPDVLLYDKCSPYHYLRIEPHRDYDIGAMTDHQYTATACRRA